MQCILVDLPTLGFQHMRNLFQNTFKFQFQGRARPECIAFTKAFTIDSSYMRINLT